MIHMTNSRFDIEVSSNARNVTVLEEGPPESIFDKDDNIQEAEGVTQEENNQENAAIVDDVVGRLSRSGRVSQEDIKLLEQDGFEIDDNNEPVIEIESPFVETRKNKNKIDECEYKKNWGWNGFDPRRKEGVHDRKAKIIGKTEENLKCFILLD